MAQGGLAHHAVPAQAGTPTPKVQNGDLGRGIVPRYQVLGMCYCCATGPRKSTLPCEMLNVILRSKGKRLRFALKNTTTLEGPWKYCYAVHLCLCDVWVLGPGSWVLGKCL